MNKFFLRNLFIVVKQHKNYRGLNFQKISALAQIPNHSNTDEPLKFLKEVIKPYLVKQRKILKSSAGQKELVIMDPFTGQMTTAILGVFKEANLRIVNVPANVTKFDQTLDLTVNDYCKQFLKPKFNKWDWWRPSRVTVDQK